MQEPSGVLLSLSHLFTEWHYYDDDDDDDDDYDYYHYDHVQEAYL
jgi:hypothetical protein